LILHQRNERRDDHTHSFANERRNLEAKRLAAAGRHQDQRITALGYMRDDIALLPRKAG
jgi:hypothetical protein